MTVPRITETHRSQTGQKRRDLEEVLLCSGYEEETSPHAQGLALMLSKEARKAFI